MLLRFGSQTLGDLDEATGREWLVTDGLGGYAAGTIAGLATRRYHGLLMVAVDPPRRRMLGLASLDPALVIGDSRVPLATHQWADLTLAPAGHRLLSSFELVEGVPRWQWTVGDVVVERELAMTHGRPGVGVVHRVVAASRPVRLELDVLCTWRDAHGERGASGSPEVVVTADGFVFEGAYRVRGPGFRTGGAWYRGWHHREEASRGLAADEDVWSAGMFTADLEPGDSVSVEAWSGDLDEPVPPAGEIVAAARRRFNRVTVGAADPVDRMLAHAADQMVVAGPTVVAGYPWFGDWSRDTMTAYEGLFLATGRVDQGRELLLRAAASVSEGMLANTADVGATEYNTVDATPWFLHALCRHVELTGDLDLASRVFGVVDEIVDWHERGTRYGIRLEGDGLIGGGAPGVALTWMDARVAGEPITARIGKPVEVNALWLSALAGLVRIGGAVGHEVSRLTRIHATGAETFRRRFVTEKRLLDIVDGPGGDDATLRPNQLLAVSLPDAPLADLAPEVVDAVAPLVTPVGLRSLAPGHSGFTGRHRGGPAERDRAYHTGTVWPWLIGPYTEAAMRAGRTVVLSGLENHLGEWGLGSVSETADGDAPHAGTGCPFQAWSVAETIRARHMLSSRPDLLQVSAQR
jgi:predicted glycogen debranching enzyme